MADIVKEKFFDSIYADSIEVASEMLIKSPSLIEISDENGFSPFDLVAILGYSRLAQVLIKHSSSKILTKLAVAMQYAKEADQEGTYMIFQKSLKNTN